MSVDKSIFARLLEGQMRVLQEALDAIRGSPATPTTSTKFDDFIRQRCEVRCDAVTSAHELQCAFRLFVGEVKREHARELDDYLKRRFDKTLDGFRGVYVKPLEYSMSTTPSVAERFVFDKCVFKSTGKVFIADLLEQFDGPKKELNDFLKAYPHTLPAVIMGKEGKPGMGVWGIELKDGQPEMTSNGTSGKTVEKRRVDTDEVVETWPSLKEAAAANRMTNATSMSNAIKKERKTRDGLFYFRLQD
jgi:hypothetical protein